MSTYGVFKTGIQPKGFSVIGFGDFIDNQCVATIREIISLPGKAAKKIENIFIIRKRYYSLDALEYQLMPLLNDCLGK